MRPDRRGIVLPAILAVLVALALLAALAMMEAGTALRVATLAQDRLLARAAATDGLRTADLPGDLPALCLRSPLSPAEATRDAPGGTTVVTRWRYLGGGVFRVEVEGRGRAASRHRLQALMRADPPVVIGAVGCAGATRLVPAGMPWREGHPEG